MSGTVLGAHYVCDGCGRDRSGRVPLSACVCGSTVRRRIDTVGATYGRPATVGSPQWDPLKDWTIKYLQFMWNIGQLRRMYTPVAGASAVEVRNIVDRTFASCLELADWLTRSADPVAVTPGDVERLLRTEPLSVCAAFVSTDEAEAATVLPMAFVPSPQFWVRYQRPNARPVRYDALDLAERCRRAWQGFLTRRGVDLPSWQD